MITFKKLASAAASFAVIALVAPSGQMVAVPDQAIDNSPVIVPLGEAIDPQTGKVVEGFEIIHYKKGYGQNAKAKQPGGSTVCYAFLSSGARWKTTEQYLFNSTNVHGLDETTLHSLMATAVETWDAQTSFDIFGNETSGVVDGAESSAPDGKNEVLFGDAGGPGTIAVTIVWGVFRGPVSGKYLAEWDMVFDNDFPWSLTGETAKMDFLNIAVHEIGHAAGMGHPNDSCAEETMYRYADYGEIKKRDLNTGDIQGLKKLYGL